MKFNQHITLKHLLLNAKKHIGLQFHTNKVLNILIQQLIDVQWNEEFNMYYVPNTSKHLDAIFSLFRGVAWIDSKYFFENTRSKQLTEIFDVAWYRKRKRQAGFRYCPEIYLQKLELKQYANNTVKSYVSCFEKFINHYPNEPIDHLNENDIRNYLQYLIQIDKSKSYINQAINSIKFYYEVVQGMPNRFYSIERPIKDKKLPVSCCANKEFAFNFFPTEEIIKPETGSNIKTNKVNFALIANMEINVRTMVKGSRTTVSNEVKKETSTSCTSEVIRAIISPFFFSEK